MSNAIIIINNIASRIYLRSYRGNIIEIVPSTYWHVVFVKEKEKQKKEKERKFSNINRFRFGK